MQGELDMVQISAETRNITSQTLFTLQGILNAEKIFKVYCFCWAWYHVECLHV